MAENSLLNAVGLSQASVELLMRLPPLYLMDAILLHEMGFFTDVDNDTLITTTADGTKVSIKYAAENDHRSFIHNGNTSSLESAYAELYGDPDLSVLPYLLNLTVGLTLYLLAACVITFNLRQLMVFYVYLTAAAAIPLSFLSHKIMLDALDGNHDIDGREELFIHKYFSVSIPFLYEMSSTTKSIWIDYLMQSCLGLVLTSILRPHFDHPSTLTKVTLVSMLSPTAAAIFGFPVDAVRMCALCSLLLPTIVTGIVLHGAFGTLYATVKAMIRDKRTYIQNFGLNTFLEREWTRLKIPSLLRAFWLSRILLHLCLEMFKNNFFFFSTSAVTYEAMMLTKRLFTGGAETLISVLGMTSVVSTVCHYIGSFFHMILTAANDDEDEKSVASVSAVLFFVLALQTGVTSLEPEKRFSRLCKNITLLSTALLHFILNFTSPVLMSLSAGQNYNTKKHLRALFICAFLVVAPIMLMYYLWQSFTIGTWLLAVTAFCVEVIVKVAVTIAVYLLFLYDQRYRDGSWEHLDDSVYYVKAVGNTIEFCFAVFLFFNGGWILIFESGGTIRAVMMLIHAYCNIWLEARAGWQAFIKRRTAMTKINSLPDATNEQLEDFDDVCAICYQDLTSAAKVTKCKHFFHGACLRKWLFLQDTCPLCHSPLYNLQNQPQKAPNNNNNDHEQQRRNQQGQTDRQQQQQQQQQHHQAQQADCVRQQNNGAQAENEVENDLDIIDNDDIEGAVDEDSDSNSDSEVGGSRRDSVMVANAADLSRHRNNSRSSAASSSSSLEERSDLDLIYDSMEDFGVSSSGVEDDEDDEDDEEEPCEENVR